MSLYRDRVLALAPKVYLRMGELAGDFADSGAWGLPATVNACVTRGLAGHPVQLGDSDKACSLPTAPGAGVIPVLTGGDATHKLTAGEGYPASIAFLFRVLTPGTWPGGGIATRYPDTANGPRIDTGGNAGDPQIRLMIGAPGPNQAYQYYRLPGATDGAWHLFVGTISGNGSYLYALNGFYDGKPVAYASYATAFTGTPANEKLAIFTDGAGGFHLPGFALDEFCYFDRALGAGEVRALWEIYTGQLSMEPSPLVMAGGSLHLLVTDGVPDPPIPPPRGVPASSGVVRVRSTAGPVSSIVTARRGVAVRRF